MVLLGGIAAPEEVRLGREMVGTGAGIMPGTTCSKARFRTGMICSLKQMRLRYFFLYSLFHLPMNQSITTAVESFAHFVVC